MEPQGVDSIEGVGAFVVSKPLVALVAPARQGVHEDLDSCRHVQECCIVSRQCWSPVSDLYCCSTCCCSNLGGTKEQGGARSREEQEEQGLGEGLALILSLTAPRGG